MINPYGVTRWFVDTLTCFKIIKAKDVISIWPALNDYWKKAGKGGF